MISLRLLVYMSLAVVSMPIFASEDLVKQIDTVYTTLFKDKLLLKRIDPTVWNELVVTIGAFVKNKTNDAGLQKDYIKLSQISNDAISGSKLLYNLSYANPEAFKASCSAIGVAQKLAALNIKNKELAERIDNTVYFWGSKRQVQHVLLELSKTISKILTEIVGMYKISYFVHKKNSG